VGRARVTGLFEHKPPPAVQGIDASSDHPGLAGITPADPFAAARRQREANAQDQTRDFVVPGYERLVFGTDEAGDDVTGQLIARYVRLHVDQYNDDIAAAHVAEDGVAANAQFLIDALVGDGGGLFYRVDGRLVDIIPGERVGWHDMAERVAPDLPETASATDQLILGVFTGNTIFVKDHAAEVARWMEEGHAAAQRAAAGGS
jgi:hypothetical protein